MSEKIVLVDGHSILNRAFYGLPDLTNWEGKHTNAVYGFLNILFRTLEEEKPDYLAVAFDLHAPTFRHKMFAEYKGTRNPMPQELREQVPLMKEVLQAMGVVTLELEGYEADDLLGTAARQGEGRGMEVTILSGDRDLLQLATEKTMIRIPKTKGGKTVIEDYLAEDVKERYQVTPAQFIDVKALMGDTADNIPGIPGVGEKTATKLILQFGSIEEAHRRLEEVKPNKARLSLEEHYDLAELSKDLATIRTDAPCSWDWEQARIGNLYTPEAYQLFKQLEFKNLLSRFEAEDREQENLHTEVIADFGEAEKLFEKAGKQKEIGAELITEDGNILGLALAFPEMLAYLPAEGFVSGSYLREKTEELFEKVPRVGVMNLKEMLRFLKINCREGLFDCGVGAYLLNPLKSEYTCDDLAKEYLNRMLPSAEEIFGSSKLPLFSQADQEKTAVWAGYRAYTAWAVLEPVYRALEEQGMERLYCEIELPLIFTLSDMEKEGIRAEGEALKVYGEQLQVRIKELEEKIYEQAGERFNINSPKQLGGILFERLQMPGGRKTKSGYSTAADVLDKLAPDYPIVADILEYRQLAKLKSTYADGLAGYIGEDGRIHSTFNQTITATGRISSTEPNLQNIPVRMELGRMIRKVFVPREGFLFLDADYSQIELRVLAHLSGDEQLIRAYREAQDIHQMTASQVFHVPFEKVTPLQRRNAKAVNFGIVYGISSFGLSQDLSITRKEAAQYIENYFETYPKIKGYLDGLVAQGKELGYVSTMYGRRRPVPELHSSNFMQRSFGERVAMNAPIQGTAADIIKIAMNRVHSRLKEEGLESRLILQVHDELLIETKEEELGRVSEILEEEMRGAASLAVPLEIDMHTGHNWYEAK